MTGGVLSNSHSTRKTERKIVSISSKRQITIPQKYYTMLGFTDEAECIMRGGELILRPKRTESGGEFAEFILRDLINEGYSGEKLLSEFKARQAKIRPAVEALIADSNAARERGECLTHEDIFGDLDDDEDEDDEK